MTGLAVSIGIAKLRFLSPAAGVDADDETVQIHQRPSAVAGINRRVHLDPVAEITGLQQLLFGQIDRHPLGVK